MPAVLVLCALPQELGGFVPPPGVTVVPVGIGPVEAAIGTARALAAGHYTHVVSAGIGGGFPGQVAVGDAVAVTSERYVEIGREDGSLLEGLPGGATLAVACTSDAALLAPYRSGVLGATLGAGITSATITTSDARAALLAERFTPHVESMEGFAVLRAAQIAGLPALELRGISNLIGSGARASWDFRAGASATARALDAFLTVVKGIA